jgi:hypothetical protein
MAAAKILANSEDASSSVGPHVTVAMFFDTSLLASAEYAKTPRD